MRVWAWGGKSRAGGAERSGHLCLGSVARSVARRVCPASPGGAGIYRSMKGGLMSKGMMGVCVLPTCFHLYMRRLAFIWRASCLQRQCVKWHTHNIDPDNQL